MSAKDILKLVEEKEAKFIDYRFTNTQGKEQHVTVTATEDGISTDCDEGKMFDGSSIAGWKDINESDMILMPDTSTAFADPFYDEPTINVTCGSKNLTEPRAFNLMLKTNVGPVIDDSSTAYLRPETAQQIFINFKNVLDSTSRSLPFGIAQIGKSFRNEITPRNFIFRVREFEQMELEFFVLPGEDDKWHKIWVDERVNWWIQQGIPKDKLNLLDVTGDDLAHYSKATVDIMYAFPHGNEELEGIANRTDFDLGSHTKNQSELNLSANVKVNNSSNTRLAVQSDDKSWITPYVIEPSAGVDRGVLALLNEAYTVEELADDKSRTVLKLKKHLSPIKAAVIPLKRNNSDLVNLAHSIKSSLQSLQLGRTVVENTGNIGKSYRKHDEIGTPICITVDFDSLEKNTVTIRDRDSMEQSVMPITELKSYFSNYFSND